MVTAITVVGAASPTVTEVSMETKYERLLRVDGATDEQLNAARVETNVLARQRLAEAIARIDRGEDVEAFAFGIAFRNDEQCDVSMGGDGRASVGLLDTLHWGIVKNTVQNGVLLPSLPWQAEQTWVTMFWALAGSPCAWAALYANATASVAATRRNFMALLEV